MYPRFLKFHENVARYDFCFFHLYCVLSGAFSSEPMCPLLFRWYHFLLKFLCFLFLPDFYQLGARLSIFIFFHICQFYVCLPYIFREFPQFIFRWSINIFYNQKFNLSEIFLCSQFVLPKTFCSQLIGIIAFLISEYISYIYFLFPQLCFVQRQVFCLFMWDFTFSKSFQVFFMCFVILDCPFIFKKEGLN